MSISQWALQYLLLLHPHLHSGLSFPLINRFCAAAIDVTFIRLLTKGTILSMNESSAIILLLAS